MENVNPEKAAPKVMENDGVVEPTIVGDRQIEELNLELVVKDGVGETSRFLNLMRNTTGELQFARKFDFTLREKDMLEAITALKNGKSGAVRRYKIYLQDNGVVGLTET